MAADSSRLKLVPRTWYGWQMVPGYGSWRNHPYFSPIRVLGVQPHKSGRSILGVRFVNALYANGVKEFNLDLRILKREANYLVAELLYGSEGRRDRTAIISRIEMEWLERFCPELLASSPPRPGSPEATSPARYLDRVFDVAFWEGTD